LNNKSHHILLSGKQKRPEPFGSGRTNLSVVPPAFGIFPALMNAFASVPITVGNRCGLLFFQPNAPGRLHRPLHRNSHQPFPLFASACRVLLPFLAVFNIPLQYSIPIFDCQVQDRRKISFFSRRMIRFSSLEI